mmetsp:Transcript_29300/g.70651  ORF Transcript_29300/g.70651 Transcript_29300/m.70651 type:complete len:94 (-) Transcript_29300:1199-1480(-)
MFVTLKLLKNGPRFELNDAHPSKKTFLTYVCCIPCIPFKWFIETKTKTVKGFREVCDLRETSLFANLEPINMFTIRLRFGISESLGVCVGVGR